jgi:hypothetical protein
MAPMTRPLSILFLVLTIVPACYGSAPPRPQPVALPPLSDDAMINVYTESRQAVEPRTREERACPAGVDPKTSKECVVTYREVLEPVTHTSSTATYGPEPINYGQFRVLTDPEHDRKLARLDELSTRCKRANIPRWIGTTLVLGGLVAAVAGNGEGAVGIGGLAAIGGGSASYILGLYAFGGIQCNEAATLYDQLDNRQNVKLTTVPGEAVAAEMKALADRFNQTRAAAAPPPDADLPAAPPPAEPPSPPTSAPAAHP